MGTKLDKACVKRTSLKRASLHTADPYSSYPDQHTANQDTRDQDKTSPDKTERSQNDLVKADLDKASLAQLAKLEGVLGHSFTRRDLLVRALTHRSLANELAASAATAEATTNKPPAPIVDNERLEFLGDAVLGMVVAEALFKKHAEWQEGELTRIRAQLVSRKHMAEVAEQIGLGQYLRLSRSEDKTGLRRKGTVLSNSMEAVIAALFLDGGLEPVRQFVRHHILAEAADQLAEELRSGAALGNYKSALQEHLQAAHAGVPIYRVKGESGPDHRKRFLVEVRVRPSDGEPGTALARGTGSTKKNAEQDAAQRALDQIRDQINNASTDPIAKTKPRSKSTEE